SGPNARFAGLRKFTLIGLLAGLGGWLWSNGLQILAVVLLVGCAALILAADIAASRVEVDGTTEMTARMVLGACRAGSRGHSRLVCLFSFCVLIVSGCVFMLFRLLFVDIGNP